MCRAPRTTVSRTALVRVSRERERTCSITATAQASARTTPPITTWACVFAQMRNRSGIHQWRSRASNSIVRAKHSRLRTWGRGVHDTLSSGIAQASTSGTT